MLALVAWPDGVAAADATCRGNGDLASKRIIEIDARDGPRFGRFQYEQTLKLRAKEVVLTFDDGPHPVHTPAILDALDAHCVKAAFFPVGRRAAKRPSVIRDMARRGHTIGGHSWSHPPNLSKLKLREAQEEIEKGFAAVRAAARGPIAPFFRYPGLNDSPALNAYLASRDYAVFSCDISSDDWTGISARQIVSRTIARIKRKGRGIVLLHDRKPATAKAVPLLLKALKRAGYRVVQIVPKMPEEESEEGPIQASLH